VGVGISLNFFSRTCAEHVLRTSKCHFRSEIKGKCCYIAGKEPASEFTYFALRMVTPTEGPCMPVKVPYGQ